MTKTPAAQTDVCYLEELFGHMTEEDHAACAAVMAHRDALHAKPAKPAKNAATPCPKCMGSGRISAFQHIKGGECFSCGGSGLFTRF